MQVLTHRVVVYGTLRRGEANAHYLKSASYIEELYAKGYQLQAYRDYPFAYFDPDSKILGELYAVSSAILA